MRRNVGLGAINKKKLAESKYKEKGYELAQDQLNELSKHLEQFRDHLQDFAAKHKNEIKKNPTFRRQFQGTNGILTSYSYQRRLVIYSCISSFIHSIIHSFRDVRFGGRGSIGIGQRILVRDARRRRFLLRTRRPNRRDMHGNDTA